ncbi:MAG: citryl-CoA lyase [Methylobacterium sp.]|nr:citryl-CoA lyase [Cupriavidus sp.]MCA3663566.1 citryl-CoA lyase [Methylobacterium sp.]MCA3666097.1 citryl-CoA lyase [Methylobacterium sp.]MCA3678764.1 citryl-CoA lyase [Methylobacterium sp.]MCA3682455.1 citryl-CoA lyase [Methylobacterium sp.]
MAMSTGNDDPRSEAAHYWRTSICDISPGRISFRGYPVQDLIGSVSFPAMIWLMLRGELPTVHQASLLEAALVASVDHGPQAPSIAVSRMAVSCGLPLNGAMASAINMLDDVHGGAGQQALELYLEILACVETGETLDAATAIIIDQWTASHGKYLPGFGHRFHPVDPRAGRLMDLVEDMVGKGVVTGRIAAAARAVEALMAARKGKLIPMNIDGATAVIYGELGFPPPLARGIFCLSRAVGILAHAWEQSSRGERNKGPMPRSFSFLYEGKHPKESDDRL